MLIQLPGEPIDKLHVGVHAVPGVGGVGPRLGEERTCPRRCHRDENNRQAGICWPRPRACRTGSRTSWRVTGRAQSDRAWMKILISGKESFRETVPANAHFVQFRWGENVNVRNGNELNARRGHRVESLKLAAR